MSRRLLVGPVLRRSVILIDGAARGALIPTLIPLLILCHKSHNLPFSPLAATYWLADGGYQGDFQPYHVYLTAGLLIAFYLVGQFAGQFAGSSHFIGNFFSPSQQTTFHFRFSVLSSIPLCLVVLTLYVNFRSSSMLVFLRMLTALFAGLATRIASRRIKVKLATSPSQQQNRGRLRSYSHVFGGALNMGDDAEQANDEEEASKQPAKKSKYDDSGLPARVSSGAVRVYLAGLGFMAFASGYIFDHFHPEPTDGANDGGGWVRVNSDGSFAKPGPSELFLTNFRGHSFLFSFTLLSLSTVVCSYILRVFYRAEVVAGKKHGLQVEIYAMKAALAFVCKSLGICFRRNNKSSARPTTTSGDEQDLEAGIPLMNSDHSSRRRAKTNDSDEFFDATSHEGDVDDSSSLKSLSWDKNDGLPSSHSSNSSTQVSVYSDRKCINPSTGKVSNFPPGLVQTRPPKNFIKTCNNDRNKAMLLFQNHLKWRLEERIGSVHTRPHPFYETIKHHYPHFIHGHSKDGYPVVYEQPGRMDLKNLFKQGCTIEDMIHHFVYHMEYLTHILRPKIRKALQIADEPGYEPLPGLVVVMDVKGMSITQLNGDVISYLKAAGDMTNNNYPGCQHKMLVVNAPFWFSGAWGGVKNVMPKETQAAASVRSSNFIDELTKHIDIDQIPMEYCGNNMHSVFNHPYEVALKSFVGQVTSGDGHDEVCDEGSVHSSLGAAASPRAGAPVTPKNELKDAAAQGPRADDRNFTFDHVAQKWVREVDDDDDENDPTPDGSHLNNALKAGSWKTELTTTPERSHKDSGELDSPQSHQNSPFNNPVRRSNVHKVYGSSSGKTEGIVHVGKAVPTYAQVLPGEEQTPEVSRRVLDISSVIYFFACALQASSETTIPFWLLIGNYYGGLQYRPSDVGKLVFSVCFLLIGMSMRRVLRRVARLPNRSPLRAFRIGIGSQAFAFFFLPVIPIILKGSTRKDSSWAVWISTVIVVSALVLTTTLSRASSAVLHRIASHAHAEKQRGGDETFMFGLVDARRFLISGGATSTVSAIGEVAGALFGAYVFVKSVQGERSYPVDSSSVFLGNCLVSSTCYFLSLTLHVNIVGDYGKDKINVGFEASETNSAAIEDDYWVGEDLSEKGNATPLPSRCGLWGEIFNIPAGDLAVLIEQATWR